MMGWFESHWGDKATRDRMHARAVAMQANEKQAYALIARMKARAAREAMIDEAVRRVAYRIDEDVGAPYGTMLMMWAYPAPVGGPLYSTRKAICTEFRRIAQEQAA